jgi:glycosyltransferase involved in cell wall biosynthesis
LEKAPWAKIFDIKTSFLQKIPFAQSQHELLAPLMPLAFENFDFGEYDLVISLTSEAAKGIITKPGTIHICYCLTPTRYLWSGYDEYFKDESSKLISRPIIESLRKWDVTASKRPDKYIAISKEVQNRIKKYYGRDSVVVYPPVAFSAKVKERKSGRAKNGYFLVVSRLSKFTRYKRIDLAIDACNELRVPLKIVGSGSLRKDLEKEAGPTIEFLGEVNDGDLVSLYQNCDGLIFPGFEDFGLVMVEAQMAGKPVIAFRGGGAEEIINDRKTGLFFDEQNTQSIIEALKKFDKFNFNSEYIQKNAEKFGMERFEKEFLSVVNSFITGYNK